MEASFFTADQLRMIAEFVSQRGGGLLTLGGRHSFAEGGYAQTPLADVLPVVLEERARRRAAFFAELKVEPTPFGMTHGVTQLAATEEESARAVEEAAARLHPEPDPAHAAGRGDASSSAAARPWPAPQVVLAYQRYGAGKSLAFTAHDSWLWQMHADIPLEDMTHENLWRQLLRWLVSGVPGPVAVSVSPQRTAPGPSVTIVATVSDETLPPGERRPGGGAGDGPVGSGAGACRSNGRWARTASTAARFTAAREGEPRRARGGAAARASTLGSDTVAGARRRTWTPSTSGRRCAGRCWSGSRRRRAAASTRRQTVRLAARTTCRYSGGGATVQEHEAALGHARRCSWPSWACCPRSGRYRKRRGLA